MRSLTFERRVCSRAVPPIGNCTLPRRFLFDCCDYISVRFDDAIDRADADAPGGIRVTLAFDTGSLVNDIGDAIAFANGFGRAFGYARATGDAIFGNFHCHGRYSFKDLVLRI